MVELFGWYIVKLFKSINLLAAYSMLLIGTPQTATHNVLAPLVECAEKASVSLPAKHKVSFIQ